VSCHQFVHVKLPHHLSRKNGSSVLVNMPCVIDINCLKSHHQSRCSKCLPSALKQYLLTSLLTPWHYSSCRTLATSHILCEVSWQQIFTGWDHHPHAQPSTWRTGVSLLVWHLPRNLPSMGGPTSSYANAGIILEFIGAHKPPHPAMF
jgi:hypothetical protein